MVRLCDSTKERSINFSLTVEDFDLFTVLRIGRSHDGTEPARMKGVLSVLHSEERKAQTE